MKNNSLLDRLFCTKCNYMQIHLCSVIYTFHAQKEKKLCCHKKKFRVHKVRMKIEDIKARCAPRVYIMLQRSRSTKRPRRTTR